MLRALDLFCGAGGVARGLKEAGYNDLREAFGAHWIPADAPITHQRRALNAMIPSCYAEWLARHIPRR